MSNEADLDWLVRNVHKWPCGKHQPWCYVVTKIDGERALSSNVLSSSFPYSRVDKDQWLARRAELQNKPGWGSVGSDINFISQHDDGQWIGHSEKPSEGAECFECHCVVSLFGYGEVLGDWRDTLEKRPEQDEFEPFVSVEGSKEQDMKQDNGWFERGELPPVGAVCLYVVSDRLSAEVEITAHAKFGLCFVEVGKSGENYVSKTAELHRFRPVRTERDVLLSIIVEEMNRYDTDGKLADAILAAGFSLRAK